MTAEEIARICGGKIIGELGNKEIKNVTVDSRKCDNASLFIARNDKILDNYCYIGDALDNGAAVMSCGEAVKNNSIIVSDSEKAFEKLTSYCRERNGGKVIAVTGSVGKTTVKELCVSILKNSGRLKVNHTEGNKNNLLGLPLTLLKTEKFDVTVLEAGISEPGEMEKHSETAQPDIAVITNIGMMHSGQLGGDVAREKLKITSHMKNGGTFIIPSDSEFLRNNSPSFLETLTVGESGDSDIEISNISEVKGGTSFDVAFGEERYRKLYVPIYGKQGAINGAFALAATACVGANEEDIRQGLAAYLPCGDRQRVIVRGDMTVVSDCYNAGPESTAAALEAFPQIVSEHSVEGAEKIILLGDMLELSEPEKEHFKIGEMAAKLNPDLLIAYGDLAEHIAKGAKAGGMPKENIALFGKDRESDMAELLCGVKNKPSVILVKGSRGMRLERFVKLLCENS